MYPPLSPWTEPIFLPVLLWLRHSYFNASSSVNHFFFLFLAQRPTEALHRFIPLSLSVINVASCFMRGTERNTRVYVCVPTDTVQCILTISCRRPECPVQYGFVRYCYDSCEYIHTSPHSCELNCIFFRLIYLRLLTNCCLTECLHTTALLATMKGKEEKKVT